MKTIAIPTDFTIESLNTVKGALNVLKDEKINLILVYSAYLSGSITDLLFLSKPKYLASLQDDKFTEACEILRNKYASQIKSIQVELFPGTSNSFFTHFLAGNHIDEVFIPKKYRLKLGKRGFDPIPYFKKTKLPLTEVDWNETSNVPEKNRVAELFLVTNHL